MAIPASSLWAIGVRSALLILCVYCGAVVCDLVGLPSAL
ncbi:hypothetical protein P643_64 [Klebsiella phage QL]|uniref:Uncharacterized protein n=1 Tax=Klebsiella phage QL TaxID=3062018 RepID=A0AAX4ASX5_9CAUD|nr:hypothetical protein P643_64 [Klebsiella phage QL]